MFDDILDGSWLSSISHFVVLHMSDMVILFICVLCLSFSCLYVNKLHRYICFMPLVLFYVTVIFVTLALCCFNCQFAVLFWFLY